MRKLLFVSLLLCLLPQLGFAEEFRVRGFSWGASLDAVRAGEKAALKSQSASGAVRYLVYSDTYLGEQVSVIYRFIHDKLFEATYNFETKGRKCDEMKIVFERAVADLQAKNGAPSMSEGAGCNASRAWDIGPTILESNLSTDSGRTDLNVVTTSKELSALAQQVSTVPLRQ